MKRRRTAKLSRLWIATPALACGLAAGTSGCGGVADPIDMQDPGGVATNRRAPKSYLEEKYPAAWSAAQSLLAGHDELQGRSIANVWELYRPDLEVPAYLEFELRDGSGKLGGHIIASTSGHDVPIVAWSSDGPSRVRLLEEQHQQDFSSARIHMLDFETFVADRPDGSRFESGAEGARVMPAETWAASKAFFVRRPEQLKFQQAESVADEWRRLRRADQSVVLPQEVSPLCPTDGCGGDPCRAGQPNYPACLGCQGYGYKTRGTDLISPPKWSQSSTTYGGSSCAVGCAPAAFTLIAAWAARQAGDHRDGSVWGHPRMVYSWPSNSDMWPSQSQDDWVNYVQRQFGSWLGTSCSGSEGGTSMWPFGHMATDSSNYWGSLGSPARASSSTNSEYSTYANIIDGQLINARVPVEVNALQHPWGGAHGWILWAYAYCSGEYYAVNLGLGDFHYNEYVSKYTILNNLTYNPYFGSPPVGSGVTTFWPQGLSRDYGPMTTGAGSSWCLDVAGWGTNNGDIIHQFTCHGGNNQMWQLVRDDVNQAGWLVRSVHSGRCLAPWDGGGYNGAQVVQWGCNKADQNELWRIETNFAQRVRLRHVPSGRCLDVDNSGGIAGDGKKVQVWDCNYGTNQHFDFAP